VPGLSTGRSTTSGTGFILITFLYGILEITRVRKTISRQADQGRICKPSTKRASSSQGGPRQLIEHRRRRR
jgi:hypothetical protein